MFAARCPPASCEAEPGATGEVYVTSCRGAQGICRAGDEGSSWTGAGGGCSGDPMSMSA